MLDTALATYYAIVFESFEQGDWTPKALHESSSRKGDDRPLVDAIEKVLVAHDPKVRQRLINRAAQGSLRALISLGDVRRVPPRVVRGQLVAAAGKIRAEILDARKGMWAEPGAHESLQALAVLNVWHQKVADWAPIIEALLEPRVKPDHCRTAVSVIAGNADRIDDNASARLIAALDVVRGRQAFPMWTHQHRALVQVATTAVDALSRGHLTQDELRHLMTGGPQERKTLAKVIGRRSDPAQLGLLSYLAHDRNPTVRCEAARWLCLWPLDPNIEDQILAQIGYAVQDLGVLVPQVVAEALVRASDTADAKREILERLETNVSTTVRREAGAYRTTV